MASKVIKKDEKIMISAEIGLDHHAALVVLAKEQERSISWLIRKAIKELIEREAITRSPKPHI